MDQSIVNFQAYISSSNWRKPEQLRGLLRNHSDLVVASSPLAAPGSLFTASRLALHDTENALAVSLGPMCGASSVGLMPLAEDEPTISAAPRMRWLDMPPGTRATSVEWCDDLLLVGCSRGTVLVADAPVHTASHASGLFEACGALTTSGSTLPPVGDIIVAPGTHAATTLVRSLCANRSVNRSHVAGAVGTQAYTWDLAGGPLPTATWHPHRNAEAATPVMFVTWSPQSDHVLLTGTYDGSLMLADTRGAGGGRNGIQFATSPGYMVTSGDFCNLMSFAFATSSSDGTFSVYDVRHTTLPVQTVASLQGDVLSVRWLGLNSDLLATAGTDGSVSLWNLRCPPTFCVGRAQYESPVTDLATTKTYVEQRALGVTQGGHVTLAGLTAPAMMSLAPRSGSSTLGLSSVSTNAAALGVSGGGANSFALATAVGSGDAVDRVAALEAAEAQACGCIYTRRLGEAFRLLADCAEERFNRGDVSIAARLVSLMDVNKTPVVDYDALLSSSSSGDYLQQSSRKEGAVGKSSEGTSGLLSLADARTIFLLQLDRTTQRLCTTTPLDCIRQLQRPDPGDIRRLESLRLNMLLHRVLASGDVDRVESGVREALALLSGHPDSFELIDSNIVCAIVRMLLERRFEAGEKFVKFVLSMLADLPPSPSGTALSKSILSAAQEPLLTAGLSSRFARRLEERFFGDLDAARDAVCTQLEIRRLGVSNYKEVIACVNNYQGRCIQQQLPGMFGWLAVEPLTIFLRCLTADSSYVTFFWVSVQCVEAFARFPNVCQIEAVLFAVVDRICRAAQTISSDLDELGELDHFSVPQLRRAGTALQTAHGFLAVLLRVQLECENVAVDSHMAALPVVMERILDLLDSTCEDVLETWAGLLDGLTLSSQLDLVRRYCLTTVRDFSFSVEDLVEISAKKDGDERLQEILDVCDEFMDAVVGQRAQ